MTQPIDIIRSALQDIGVVAGDEPIEPGDATIAFVRMNRFLSWLNTQKLAVAYSAELVIPLAATVANYTIGPTGTAGALINANITGFVLTVIQVLRGSLGLGQVLSDAGAQVLPGTQIVGYGTGSGDVVLAPGTYRVNLSQNVSAIMTATYQRPLQANLAFVRAQGFDFPVSCMSASQWAGLPQKLISNNAWPVALYLEASWPNSNLTVYPVPGSATELHLFADVQLQRFASQNDTIVLPDQYEALLQYGTANLCLAPFGIQDPSRRSDVKQGLSQSLAAVKTMNRRVPTPSQIDPMLARRPTNGAAYVLTGGY